MMDAHFKNVEKSSLTGKFDPFAGLSTSGIAGTGPDKDKEEEEQKPQPSTSESQPKDGGWFVYIFKMTFIFSFLYLYFAKVCLFYTLIFILIEIVSTCFVTCYF